MASRGVNKVILVGNLGADPEVRYMPSGGAVTNVNLATSESWKDKQTGQPQERTEWHRIVFFNRLAETATPRKSSPMKCRCSTAARAAARWAVTITGVTSTTRALRRNRRRRLPGHPAPRRRAIPRPVILPTLTTISRSRPASGQALRADVLGGNSCVSC